MSDKPEELPYEAALERLEHLLEAMEEGHVPLAELVEKFAEGNRLLKVCEKRLQEAELKVEKLLSAEDPSALAPLEPPAGDS